MCCCGQKHLGHTWGKQLHFCRGWTNLSNVLKYIWCLQYVCQGKEKHARYQLWSSDALSADKMQQVTPMWLQFVRNGPPDSSSVHTDLRVRTATDCIQWNISFNASTHPHTNRNTQHNSPKHISPQIPPCSPSASPATAIWTQWNMNISQTVVLNAPFGTFFLVRMDSNLVPTLPVIQCLRWDCCRCNCHSVVFCFVLI